MGFNNISYYDTVDSMNKVQKSKINNPYYAFTEASKAVITYYHINEPKTTLDYSTKDQYDYISDESPIRYDKINKFPIYGLDKIIPDLEIGEFGLEASQITGDAIILPNTIKPSPDDYFFIDYINKKLLFRVTNVTTNIIENDNVMYKISYILDNSDKYEVIDKQVITEWTYTNVGEVLNDGALSPNGGIGPSSSGIGSSLTGDGMSDPTGAGDINTNYRFIVKSSNLDNAQRIRELVYKFTMWYIELFYNDRLEAFILKHRNQYLYDEYLTEFIIRNAIVSVNEHKIHVTHQTNLPRTFSIDYEKTFFRFIELRKYPYYEYTIKAYPKFIDDLGSTLADRAYDYFKMKYVFDNNVYAEAFPIISTIDNNLLYHIEQNKTDPDIGYQNLIVKYFNNQELIISDLDYLDRIDFKHNIEFFYNMPILIMILRKWSKSLVISKTLK